MLCARKPPVEIDLGDSNDSVKCLQEYDDQCIRYFSCNICMPSDDCVHLRLEDI